MSSEPAFISAGREAAAGDPAIYFRREFIVEQGLQNATLRVTALGIVEPYLNGTRVGEEMLAPGWTSYTHRIMVSTYDVTDLLSTGPNALGAIVGEGWAVGALAWENRRHHYADRPALFVELRLRYENREEVVGSDEQFRVGTGAVRSNGLYAGEEYDARSEPRGWTSSGFDDRGWERAQRFEWDLDSLCDLKAEPIRRIEEIAPVSIRAMEPGRVIVDFGQNLSGWVRLTVSGERGRTITLRHAEVLAPSGELETETNRTAAATDRYTLCGDGIETWEPRFTFHGFRYVEVEGWPGDIDSDALRAVVVHSDMTRTGWFESSNALVTKLHENTVWSMRDNFVGVPTDCPQRDERLGWTGDLNAFAPTATFLYDVRGVLRSWLDDLAAEQAVSGAVPWIVPDILGTPSSPTALWSDVAISLPWELYQEYGDVEILRRAYPSMTAFMGQVEAALDDDGLWGSGFQFGDWLDPGAPADNPAGGKTDRYLVACAYLCRTTRELAATAALLGETSDHARYVELAARVTDAFRGEFVTGRGRLASETATAYALAIMFDLLDDAQREKAGERLAAIVGASGYTISTGFAGTPLVTDALSSTGHLDEAYLLLLQEQSPSFLYPVTMGATTIWERWDAILPDGTLNSTGMTSLNHYALGAVSSWLHRVVGGLERADVGWRRIRVAPKPGGGLTWARSRHDTVLGAAEVFWRIDGEEIVLDIEIPSGAIATVELPLHPDAAVAEVGPGTHSWRYALPAGYTDAKQYTLDSLMRDLVAVPAVWSSVLEVLRKHLPGVPIEAAGAEMAGMTLGSVLHFFSDDNSAVERDLTEALASTR